MNVLDAENCFKKGLVALVDGRDAEAMTLFRSAIVHERVRGGRRQMKYRSYFGLSVARAHGPSMAAIRTCETAVRRDPTNPDHFLNLGRVLLMSGKRVGALAAFEGGLRIAPRHRALRAELERVDRRRKPTLPFLPRGHSLNLLLGRLRARWTAPRGAPAT